MIYIALAILGLCLGSFVNALVWRLRKQALLRAKKPKDTAAQLRKLSITRGRSMCMHCGHELAPKDLVPVASWVYLRGKCRYCGKKIEDTPFTELLLPLLFVGSYYAWPYAADGWNTLAIGAFIAWLLLLTVYLGMAVYDARWYILPNTLVAWATVFAGVLILCNALYAHDMPGLALAFAAGALFFAFLYALFRISNETWIGGGDVKLAFSLGLVAGSPLKVVLLLFIASVMATLVALPGIITKKKTGKSQVPFGPYLIIASSIVFLWGQDILDWYLSLA